jgi:hypothetical protein
MLLLGEDTCVAAANGGQFIYKVLNSFMICDTTEQSSETKRKRGTADGTPSGIKEI